MVTELLKGQIVAGVVTAITGYGTNADLYITTDEGQSLHFYSQAWPKVAELNLQLAERVIVDRSQADADWVVTREQPDGLRLNITAKEAKEISASVRNTQTLLLGAEKLIRAAAEMGRTWVDIPVPCNYDTIRKELLRNGFTVKVRDSKALTVHF